MPSLSMATSTRRHTSLPRIHWTQLCVTSGSYDRKCAAVVMLTPLSENGKTKQTLQIIQIQILDWKSTGACANFKIVTDVNEEVVKVQRRTGNKAIVVHCSDTATRSGMYCSIATTIDRCKTEGVVDVFQVVKALRVHKPGAVPSVDNYKDVFEALLVYLDSFDTYANFL
ncbi:receptor-type tyrosine-protein phosphatase alpha-like isoform X2 [Halichondria panicea]|uniref:receptor-type tyrosine-protein phosphatase alpha-like isoform X2 n=1 Tax=Halichondria panicea TaxID=6063 RepID=UPI00312B2E0D